MKKKHSAGRAAVLALAAVLAVFPAAAAYSQEAEKSGRYDLTFEPETVDLGILGTVKKANPEQNRFESDVHSLMYTGIFNSQGKLGANMDEIKDCASDALPSWREEYYEKHKMKYTFWDGAEQVVLGFGVVNFLQCDFAFAPLFLLGDVASYVLFFSGMANCQKEVTVTKKGKSFDGKTFAASWVLPVIGPIIYLSIISGGEYTRTVTDAEAFAPYAIGALSIKVVTAALSIWRAVHRMNKWNSSLKEALLLGGEEDKVSFAPLIDPVSGQYGMALSFRL